MGDFKSGGFEAWLSKMLMSLNSDIDLEVYVSYIVGILESEATDGARDSLSSILSGIIGGDTFEDDISDIISKWVEISESNLDLDSNETEGVDWKLKMQDIINKQAAESALLKCNNALDGHQKALILANYSQISDGEENDTYSDCPDSVHSQASKSDDASVRNMNALMVKEREKKARDWAKLEAYNKKLKDKEDKEKQKQKALERKEMEKKRTQKGEKRR